MALSVFDLDHTLLKKNSSVEFCKFLYGNKKLSFFSVLQSSLYYLRHVCFGLSLKKLHEKIFHKLLCGMNIESLEEEASAFVELYFSQLLYPPALQRLTLAQDLGHYTVILSASPSFLVKFFAEKLRVDDWKASEYLVNKKRQLCGVAFILEGDGKALYTREVAEKRGFSRESVTVYSDSYLDLPFLMIAGRAVVVNPNSRLKRIASEFHWEII